MGYEIGVLLYHCTRYGRADFDIQGCLESILNAISSTLDIKEVEQGFTSEAENYDETVDLTTPEMNDFFIEAWNALAPEEFEIGNKYVAFGCEEDAADSCKYFVQLEKTTGSEKIQEGLLTRNEAMLIAVQKAIELNLEVKEWEI